jgi:hypothetical protein
MKKAMISAFIISIFLFGCTTGKTPGTTIENPFIGGTTGVLVSFSPDAPPSQVYAGGDFPFSVLVKLKNDGEYKVPKEKISVTLTGINAEEFDRTEGDFYKLSPEDLEAKRKEDGKNVESNPVIIEFIDLNRREDTFGNTYTIRADVCYNYMTQAVSKICVRENNLDTKDGVCKVTESKTLYNSGGPIQISDFKEESQARDKVGFSFTISHKGNGQIYQQDTMCAKGIDNKRSFQDKVWVEVKSGVEGLKCSGLRDGTDFAGYTTLYDKTKVITCTQTVDTRSDYEKPIEIKVIYDYEDNAETTVQVKKSSSN